VLLLLHSTENYFKSNPFFLNMYSPIHVKCVPCQHAMARPQAADGGDGLQIWKVDENIFNKKSLIADKRWPPAWGLDVGLRIPHRK
jgi:hypothetical protein